MELLKRIGKVIIVLIVILAVAHTIAIIVLGHKVKAEIAAIKAKGDPVSFADLNKEKIPDSENAAVIYKGLFEKVKTFWDSAGNLNTVHYDGQRRTYPNLWTESGRQSIARGQSIIDEIEIATSRPKCQFPVYMGSNAYIIFERYAGMKKLAQLLSVNAIYQVATGNMDEAVRSVRLSFKLSESLKDEPYMIAYLVRVALIRISTSSLKKSLEYGDISESQAKQLYDLLANIDIYSGFEKMAIGDRAKEIDIFKKIRREGYPIVSQKIEGKTIIYKPPFRYWLTGTYIGRPYQYILELIYLDKMHNQIETAQLPYREVGPLSPEPEVDYWSLASIAYRIPSTFDRARKSRDSCVTSVAGSQILLALAAYKDRFGAYLETLAELKSKLGWKLPGDPFSGKDFLYKRQGNGFLLYSVGLNIKDDGGIEEYIKINKNDREQADIVWRMER